MAMIHCDEHFLNFVRDIVTNLLISSASVSFIMYSSTCEPNEELNKATKKNCGT